MKPPRNFGRSGGIDVLEYELLQEKAATLARLGRRLQAALAELEAFDAARQGAPSATAQDAEERAELVAAAGEALWYYVVQREVSGFRDSEAVMRHLRVPREVRLRMGMRPRRTEQ